MKKYLVTYDSSGRITSVNYGEYPTDIPNSISIDTDIAATKIATSYVVYLGKLYYIGDQPGPWYMVQGTPPAWHPDTVTQLAETARMALARRFDLLQQSDWTQLPDVLLETKTQWATYRQALRDITDQPGYPFNIVWPTPPTA